MAWRKSVLWGLAAAVLLPAGAVPADKVSLPAPVAGTLTIIAVEAADEAGQANKPDDPPMPAANPAPTEGATSIQIIEPSVVAVIGQHEETAPQNRQEDVRLRPASVELPELDSAQIGHAPLPPPDPGPVCTPAKMEALAGAAASAYKPVYYDNSFDYLDDPCYADSHLGENLKRHNLGGWGVLDVGGEYRLREHSERNIRGLGLTGRDDDFLLHRTRLYANLEVGRRLRFYAEMLDAVSNYERFRPRPIEENRAELHNCFADFSLSGDPSDGLRVRLGRQELIYGAQRTVSPLDWANTRRTFEGYKVFWKGSAWDIDAFWTRPVPPVDGQFDSPDQSQQFVGLYTTCKRLEHQKADFFYLRLVEEDGLPDFDFHTLGTRWSGEYGPWLTEAWAAVQFGSFGAFNHSAGAYTLGLGRKFEDFYWKPVLWAYFDWASGDDTLGNGYHHLFPLAHKYLGWMDLFGRRNIEDLNFLLTLSPHDKLKLLAWWHVMRLQNNQDVPYNVTMTPFVTTPGGSGELGQELDLMGVWTVSPRTELAVGYSHFFAGQFYRTNPAAPYAGDADFFYTQFSVRF